MKVVYRITKYLGYVGALFIAVMMLLTVADVFMRYVFNSPLAGVAELSALALVIIVGTCLGWCALERAHIKVDLLMNYLPKKARFVIDSIVMLLSFIMLVVMTVWTTGELFKKGQTTSVLRISNIPFQWIFWVGLIIFCICILVLSIEHFRTEAENEP